jgi:hypothetical protein
MRRGGRKGLSASQREWRRPLSSLALVSSGTALCSSRTTEPEENRDAALGCPPLTVAILATAISTKIYEVTGFPQTIGLVKYHTCS